MLFVLVTDEQIKATILEDGVLIERNGSYNRMKRFILFRSSEKKKNAQFPRKRKRTKMIVLNDRGLNVA